MQNFIQILDILKYTAGCKHVQCNKPINIFSTSERFYSLSSFFFQPKDRLGTITLVARSGTYVNFGLVLEYGLESSSRSLIMDQVLDFVILSILAGSIV